MQKKWQYLGKIYTLRNFTHMHFQPFHIAVKMALMIMTGKNWYKHYSLFSFPFQFLSLDKKWEVSSDLSQKGKSNLQKFEVINFSDGLMSCYDRA